MLSFCLSHTHTLSLSLSVSSPPTCMYLYTMQMPIAMRTPPRLLEWFIITLCVCVRKYIGCRQPWYYSNFKETSESSFQESILLTFFCIPSYGYLIEVVKSDMAIHNVVAPNIAITSSFPTIGVWK